MWTKPKLDLTGPLSRRHLDPVHRFGKLASRSATMGEVFDLLTRFAATDVTLTLLGETGTGKDVLANALHAQSARTNAPFVVFDCGSVTASLAESELFGHERGAFTGAISAHMGAFERAAGGTLFLDEIGELPSDLQPRLLRVLESRHVRRVGGGQDRSIDVRIVAATHRNLRADVTAGRFRQDLYFRLAGAVVPIPPLRERLEDLPRLVQDLLKDLGKSDLLVGDAALRGLCEHRWPGNIRELKNTLAYAAAFADRGVIEPQHLSFIHGAEPKSGVDALALGGQTLESLERAAIEQTLTQTNGNKAVAAEKLGIATSTLYEKLKKYSL